MPSRPGHPRLPAFLDISPLLLSLLQVGYLFMIADALAVRSRAGVIGLSVLLAAFTALLCAALSNEAHDRGHSRWFGLLGILSVVGVIIILIQPRRWRG
jgi:hypothetical protein